MPNDPWSDFPEVDEWEQFPAAEDPMPVAQAAPEQEPGLWERIRGVGPLQALNAVGENVAQMATGMVATPIAGYAGMAAAAIPGGRTGPEMVEDVQSALTYQPRAPESQALGQAIAYPFEKYEQFADWAGEATGDPSDTLGATGVKTAILAAPMALGMRALKKSPAKTPVKAKPLTVEGLKQASRAAYQVADDAGVGIKAQSFSNFTKTLKTQLASEGIDATLHPKSLAALRRIMETDGKNLSLKGAETLRRVAADAARSTDPADARLGRMIRSRMDDYIDNLGSSDVLMGNAAGAKALKDARSLWSRASKGEELTELVERAGVRAGQFTGSGFENALRTEFRQLAMNKKRLRRYSPAEQEAIKRVAMGGPLENTARWLGKFAPRGIVSTALGSVLGAPFGPGGPMLVWGAGEVGRKAATTLTRRNAQKAIDTALKGPEQ